MSSTAAPSPALATSRWQRVAAPLTSYAVLGAGVLALALRDPHRAGSWGLCPSRALGFWCPACGSLRAVNDLTHLDLGAAASSNLLFVALLPVAVFLLARWGLDSWRGVRRTADPRVVSAALWLLVPLMIAFTVVRNLPGGHWLAP